MLVTAKWKYGMQQISKEKAGCAEPDRFGDIFYISGSKCKPSHLNKCGYI
jgi:hypothetical protein